MWEHLDPVDILRLKLVSKRFYSMCLHWAKMQVRIADEIGYGGRAMQHYAIQSWFERRHFNTVSGVYDVIARCHAYKLLLLRTTTSYVPNMWSLHAIPRFPTVDTSPKPAAIYGALSKLKDTGRTDFWSCKDNIRGSSGRGGHYTRQTQAMSADHKMLYTLSILRQPPPGTKIHLYGRKAKQLKRGWSHTKACIDGWNEGYTRISWRNDHNPRLIVTIDFFDEEMALLF
jgi:hypothetical protein